MKKLSCDSRLDAPCCSASSPLVEELESAGLCESMNPTFEIKAHLLFKLVWRSIWFTEHILNCNYDGSFRMLSCLKKQTLQGLKRHNIQKVNNWNCIQPKTLIVYNKILLSTIPVIHISSSIRSTLRCVIKVHHVYFQSLKGCFTQFGNIYSISWGCKPC